LGFGRRPGTVITMPVQAAVGLFADLRDARRT
jgi:hypothetical protein